MRSRRPKEPESNGGALSLTSDANSDDDDDDDDDDFDNASHDHGNRDRDANGRAEESAEEQHAFVLLSLASGEQTLVLANEDGALTDVDAQVRCE